MKIKLHWKLTFIFCAVAFAGLLIGYAFLSFHLKSYLEDNLSRNLQHEITLAKHFLESGVMGREISRLDEVADKIGRDLGLRATIIDESGRVIGDTDLTPDDLHKVENHLDRPEVQQAKAQGFGISKRYSYTMKKYLLYMAVPFSMADIKGFLRFAMPITDIDLLEGRMEKIVALALLLVLAFSIVFIFVISWFVSRPLNAMVAAANRMARGDFSKKPSVYSKDEIGELARALTYMSDQIEDKIRKIKQEGAKLDAVLSSMIEGIVVTDEKANIILMNPSLRKIFLVDIEPEGKKPIEVMANAQIQGMVENIINRTSSQAREEISVNAPTEKILMVNGVPITRKGKLEGVVLVFHDITELRRLEKVRQDFVANVSHELRTPIASIMGYSETLLGGALDDKKNAKDFVQIIHEDSSRLASLINDLLDLSKIESGKMKMDLMPINLKPIIERCLGVLKKTIGEKSISVGIDIPSDLPKVRGDDKRLAQVVLNLLDNAVKYTPNGGSVKIKAARVDTDIKVDICDTGAGIPEEDLPRIFERFYRVDKSHSRELGGTGLGLSIVKHIVLAHQGQVYVESFPGRGSTFSFTIPQA